MTSLANVDFDRVRSAARDAIDKHSVPGLSIGVVQGDDLVFCEGFGYAEIESKTRMDPARRQCIASITKTMVGLCTMALVDEGKLRLEDRIVDLLPDVTFDGPAET
jgi:CubicO group peptidase (beta-lactamase class C family)